MSNNKSNNDNHSRQLNSEHEAFWKSRGQDKPQVNQPNDTNPVRSHTKESSVKPDRRDS